MARILTITIDLDRLDQYGSVKTPNGQSDQLLAEALANFVYDFGRGGAKNVWTSGGVNVGTATVTEQDKVEMAQARVAAATKAYASADLRSIVAAYDELMNAQHALKFALEQV